MPSSIDIFFVIILIIIILITVGLNITTTEYFIVADAQDFNNYKQCKDKTLKKSNTFDYEKIEIPLEMDKIDYDQDKNEKNFYTGLKYDFKPIQAKKERVEKDKKMYFSNADFGWEAPRQIVSCANSSVSQQFKSGPKSLMPYQIDCTRPNKLTAENYWKVHHKIPVIPIEDKVMLGSNYMDFSSWVEPSKIDFRILSQTTKGLPLSEKYKNIPVGTGYGFHNTPAVQMP